jgi:lysophospholipase L1-like esterase
MNKSPLLRTVLFVFLAALGLVAIIGTGGGGGGDTTPGNTAPAVTIITPAAGSSFHRGDSVTFAGTVTDQEDGNIASSLAWNSNLDGAIGSGAAFATTTLSVGTHTITAAVTDSGGLPGSDVITVTVDIPAVETPQITTVEGSYATEVTLATTTVGATLYYTIDGSAPTPLSPEYSGPFTLTSSATVKAYGVLAEYNDSAMAHAGITVNEGVFLQNDSTSQGFVIIEAENFQTNTARSGFKWHPSFNPLFTGLSAMTTTGYGKISANYAADSPRMEYQINFVTAGTHYLWLRVQGPEVLDLESLPNIRQHGIHVGLDGQEEDVQFAPTSSWTWVEAPTPVTVNPPGIYTLQIWMRESLAVIDKVVLTTDAAYTPTGAGPAESEQIMCAAPCVRISDPREDHLQSDLNISVSADVNFDDDLHTDWQVKFRLDGGDERIVAGPPFNTVFTNAGKSEHTIEAIIVDDSDQEVGAADNDTAMNVGVGDYYVAFGDSITTGLDDDDISDNISMDARNSGGGYEPVLNDLLSGNPLMSYPNIAANEGFPGDKSTDGLVRIPDVLARHPGAMHFLVLFGTNDAQVSSPVPSGLGCSGAACNGTFKGNMQQIIDAIISAGKEASLAKIPVALRNCSTCPPYQDPDVGLKNEIIKEYNLVVDELVTENAITITPPDFYSYFLVNYLTEYASWVHPNGIGYRSMATLWEQALTP